MVTKIRDIIDYYSGHEVSNDIRKKVLERISSSTDDKEANDAFRALWDKADSVYMDEADVSAAYERLFSLDETDGKSKAKSLQIFTWARVVAVVVPLLMLVVFGKIYVHMSDPLKKSHAISMLQEYTVKEESKSIVLSDGTKVRLSQSSVLLYPSSFMGAKERKVFLTGEAFFDIKHNERQPFHVSSPYFEITDLGTSFTVSSYITGEEVSTTLKSGKIELRVVGDDKVYKMKPNDQLVYNVKTKAVSLHQVSADDDGMNWRNRSIDLNDVTLAEAANIMGKAYGMKFIFQSKERYQNTKVTVHFNRGETLQGAMTILKDLIPGLEYEVKNKEVMIK